MNFSVAYPTEIILVKIFLLALIISTVAAIIYLLYKLYDKEFTIKVGSKTIELNLYCQFIKSESRSNSYIYKEINGIPVFEIHKKWFSLELNGIAPYSIKGYKELNSVILQLEDKIRLVNNENNDEITIELIENKISQ